MHHAQDLRAGAEAARLLILEREHQITENEPFQVMPHV